MWPTRDSLHRFARIVGKLRSAHAPASKHWSHIMLHVNARELTLPVGAYWQREGWIGAISPYPVLVNSSESVEALLDYLRGLQARGADPMGRHVRVTTKQVPPPSRP